MAAQELALKAISVHPQRGGERARVCKRTVACLLAHAAPYLGPNPIPCAGVGGEAGGEGRGEARGERAAGRGRAGGARGAQGHPRAAQQAQEEGRRRGCRAAGARHAGGRLRRRACRRRLSSVPAAAELRQVGALCGQRVGGSCGSGSACRVLSLLWRHGGPRARWARGGLWWARGGPGP